MDVQTALAISIPTIAVLIGILNNFRLSDLRAHVDTRITDMKETLRTEILRVEGVLDARLTNVEQRLGHLGERYR
jgi:hypothetical protein